MKDLTPPWHLPGDVAYRWFEDDPTLAGVRLAALSDEERLRLESFKAARRRHEFMLGRAAARTLLADRLGIDPPDIPLRVAADGGLDVEGTDLRVSISHASRQAVAAVGMRRVGIDLESTIRRSADLHRFVFHPEEIAEFDRLPLEGQSSQILCWALKEAALKARRSGLRYSPRRLRVRLAFDRGEAVLDEEDGSQQWQARFMHRNGLFMAIAYEQRTDGSSSGAP